MIDLDGLVRELRRRRRADWSIIERDIKRGTARAGGALRRVDELLQIGLVVHRDLGRGRGTAELELAGDRDDDPVEIVELADQRALGVIGRSWATPRPAAPAKVALEDPAIAEATSGLDAIAAGLLALLAATPVEGEATVEHTAVRLATGGVDGVAMTATWRETRATVRATLERGGRAVQLAIEARKLDDLAIADRSRAALSELDGGTGGAPAAGVYPVVFHARAHAHGGGYGLWQPFVFHADAGLVRRGLARYKLGMPVAPGAAAAAEPLDIESDGTLAFGLRSAPLGDRGEPVRRFSIVERGVARGLSLDQREAAIARREPNGGIRNLLIGAGRSGADELLRVTAGPFVEVRRLAWLDVDPHSGLGVAAIAAAVLHDDRGRHAFRGGTIRGDLFRGLATAQRSRELVTEGPVRGPAAIRVEGLELR